MVKNRAGAAISLPWSRLRRRILSGCLIDRADARSLALDLEALRRVIAGAAKSGGERHGGRAIGEFEVDCHGEGGAVATDLVGLLADRLLELM
jgi:hypothetical protein